jgi:small lipoprotein (TIGR04452 family)
MQKKSMKTMFVGLCVSILLTLFGSCAPLGIKAPFTVKGEEVRERIETALLLTTIVDASFLSSGNPNVRASATYYTVLNLLGPSMVELDDNAYYSESDVKKCEQNLQFLAFSFGTDIALLVTCNLKPVNMIGIGSPAIDNSSSGSRR